MTAQPQSTYLTPEEYLAIEREAETKSEYLDGDMIAMPGSSREHNLIVANLVAELHRQLKGRPAIVFPSDLRVWIPAVAKYTYPDVSVVREPPRVQDEHGDNLLNPTVILEVLSPGTESYDRGKKFHRDFASDGEARLGDPGDRRLGACAEPSISRNSEHYRSIESLEEYVLVSQAEERIEHFVRQDDGRWVLSGHTDSRAIVTLPSIGCELSLAEVYDKLPLLAR